MITFLLFAFLGYWLGSLLDKASDDIHHDN
jgi:hypothetical protein